MSEVSEQIQAMNILYAPSVDENLAKIRQQIGLIGRALDQASISNKLNDEEGYKKAMSNLSPLVSNVELIIKELEK